MDDITALILEDHAAFRRGFARLDDARGAEQIRAVWEPLALHLEIHAEAEERILYPLLLKRSDGAEGETEDAIRDHNKIRDAINDARGEEIESLAWWEAVWRARTENSEHLAEEEDEVLPDFRKHVSFQVRAELAAQWITFYGEHPQGKGLIFQDKDPQDFIDDNS